MIRPLIVRVAPIAVFVVSLLGSGVMSSPVKAGDLMDALSNMIGGNQVDEDQYQERSPLVVPPTKTLPKQIGRAHV